MDGPAAKPDPATLLARARALAPAIRARAAATERNRRVPDISIEELRAADLFRIVQPARWGGFEHGIDTVCEVAIEVARACGSTAWVYSTTALHQWIIAMFPEAAQADVWGTDRGAIVGGSFAPTGRAEPVDGGWRLSGRWGFASGCDNTDWTFFGVLIDGARGAKEMAMALVPHGAYAVVDTWHVLGLAGTGSKDLVLDGVFVPAHRVMPVALAQSGAPPGAAVNPDPLYRLPFLSLIAACLTGPGIGIAAGALDDFIAMNAERTTRGAALGGQKRMAEFPTVQLRVAEAAALIDAARLLLLRDCRETVEAMRDGRAPDVATRLRNRRDHAYASRLAVQAVDRLFEAAGGAGLFDGGPLQRAWRDVHAVTMHISLNWDAIGTLYGRALLGLDPGPGQY
ncbi:MAG: flavin-dependent monooxygenase [Alphaproteobacteria bacterium]|nr:flavin-dependent monooxygenase [Alphaproteobacteria bacterium]